MKKVVYSVIVLLNILNTSIQAKNIDSLQRELNIATNDTLKAKLYGNISAELVQYNMPNTRLISYGEADMSINYVLKALHLNTQFNDTLAIRDNFDCLSRAYFIQKKYAQAKWFGLQSNRISRSRRDIPHIISSLIELAKVKTSIKDYKLAKKDLDEALAWAQYTNVGLVLDVQKNTIMFYNAIGDYKAADALEKSRTILAANRSKFVAKAIPVIKPKPVKIYAEKPDLMKSIIANNQLAALDYVEGLKSKLNITHGVWAIAKPILVLKPKPVKIYIVQKLKPTPKKGIIVNNEKQLAALDYIESLKSKLNITHGVWAIARPILVFKPKPVKIYAVQKVKINGKKNTPTGDKKQQVAALAYAESLKTKLNIANGVWVVNN